MSVYAVSQNIYFIKPVGLDGPIRIGCSRWPPDRLHTLMCNSPFKLELIGSTKGTFKDERLLHRRFAATHSHSEWFYPSDDLLGLIAKINQGVALHEAITLKREGRYPRGKEPRPFDARGASAA